MKLTSEGRDGGRSELAGFWSFESLIDVARSRVQRGTFRRTRSERVMGEKQPAGRGSVGGAESRVVLVGWRLVAGSRGCEVCSTCRIIMYRIWIITNPLTGLTSATGWKRRRAKLEQSD